MLNLELTANDISCNHCKMSIEKGLAEVQGVSSVTVDVDSKRVSVVLDESQAKVGDVTSELEKLGYPAETVGA